MRLRRALLAGLAMALSGGSLHAEITVTIDRQAAGIDFRFNSVPPPATNDAASAAQFVIVDGDKDPNGGELSALHDGRVPVEEDQPAENFFFRAGADGGVIVMDLGKSTRIKEVHSYSWHGGSRAPQFYRLLGADGTETSFNAQPRRPTAPESCGWKLLATVDSRKSDAEAGGQVGVSVADPSGAPLGRFRYLLFDIRRTEDRDPFGNTFFSEIDVIDAEGPALVPVASATGQRVLKSFSAENGSYHFTIDATGAPDLMDWADSKLRPVVEAWYPKLVAMLPSDGFHAATNITLQFRNNMGGTPASAGRARVNLNSGWFRKELDREARGSVVHELVHVVQDYGRARRVNPNATRTPGWLVEGIPDYIRWFLYEPETHGAEITKRNLDRAKFDASYRITGNFLNWVVEHCNKELIQKLNAAAREGRYTEALWQELTGKSLTDLGDEWKRAQEQRVKAGTSEAKP